MATQIDNRLEMGRALDHLGMLLRPVQPGKRRITAAYSQNLAHKHQLARLAP